MKKFSRILAAVVAVASLCACFTGCAKKEDNVLTVATSPDFPPFESLDDNNEVYGIEFDILEIVCERLGYTLEINQMDFDSILPAIQAGKFDCGASGFSVTEDRQKNALFTDPYCLAAQAIVVMEGSTITGKADLEGKAVSVQSGTTAEEFTRSEGYEVKSFQANSDAEMALIQGKVDAWVIDDLTAKEMVDAYNNENSGTKLVVLDEPMTTEPYAFAFKLGNDELVDKINTVVNELVADGTIKTIFDKYNAPYTSPDSVQ